MVCEFDIFLSYAHEDGEIAASLVSRLEDGGIHCFLAEKNIRPGEQWEPRIRDALLRSRRLLLLITPRSKDSRWVNAEAGAAWALGKPLVPALMFVEPKDLIELVNRHQARKVETPAQVQRSLCCTAGPWSTTKRRAVSCSTARRRPRGECYRAMAS